LSPNREQAAVRVSGANDTLWIHDFRRGDAFSRLTFRGNVAGAVWTHDGKRIIYNIGNEIASIAADGSGDDRTLFKDQYTGVPTSITPDDKTVLYQTNRPGTGWDIWALSLDDMKAHPVLSAPFTERFARLSPDGHWIAYTSNESGRDEVYVRPFPALGSRTNVSHDGGAMPVWSSPTGTELYFRRGQEIFFVTVRATAASFENDAPQRRFAPATRPTVDSYDIMPDGRLLMIQTTPTPLPTAFNLILGWLDELKGRVAPSR
jgi:serine/threonine-protein kinase